MTATGYQWGVKALQKKRAELAGEIGQLKLQLRDRQRDLRKVDDILRILAPSQDPTRIPPKKLIWHQNLFRQGELGRLIGGILRAEGRPMGVAEITKIIMDQGGFDKRLWTPIRRRIRGNLAYMETDGRAAKIGYGPQAAWKLTSGNR